VGLGRLHEYLVKGFTVDDERLKNPPGKAPETKAGELMRRFTLLLHPGCGD
jgi:hypothetical protein